MVGILLIFVLNNLIWSIALVYMLSINKNGSIPRFPLGKKKEEDANGAPVYEEATDEQIIEHFDSFRDKVIEQTGYDENGVKVEGKFKEGVIE